MSQTKASFTFNDAGLLSALIYLMVNLESQWTGFTGCHQPVHTWLMISYAAVFLFRLVHLLGCHCSDDSAKGDFLLNLRTTQTAPWLAMLFIWAIAIPFFTCWTALGTAWLWSVKVHTPECFPPSQAWWFTILWLVVSYLWVAIHLFLFGLACVMEYRVRKAETQLRSIEDHDLTARWGRVSSLSGYNALTGFDKGLTMTEINALPVQTATERLECAICLFDVKEGEKIRQLGTCGHTFHRSCIDLWLLRCTSCPLCKRSARQ